MQRAPGGAAGARAAAGARRRRRAARARHRAGAAPAAAREASRRARAARRRRRSPSLACSAPARGSAAGGAGLDRRRRRRPPRHRRRADSARRRRRRLRPPLRRPPRRGRTRRSWWTGSSRSWAIGRCSPRRWTRRSFRASRRGSTCRPTPDSLEALRKQVVAIIVDEELLVQQAQRDTTIKVTDQEIADGVEQQVRKVRSQLQLRGRLRERAQEGRIPDARGVSALADRPAAAGGVPEPADREAAAGRQAQAGLADRAGDAGVLRRAEGQSRRRGPRRSRSVRS